MIGGSVVIGNDVFIGIGARIRPGIRIGDGAFIGMSVTVWRLGQGGGFELFPGAPDKDGQWVVDPFAHDEMKPVEDLGPVDPRS